MNVGLQTAKNWTPVSTYSINFFGRSYLMGYFRLYRRGLLGELHQTLLLDVPLFGQKMSESEFGGPSPPKKIRAEKRSFPQRHCVSINSSAGQPSDWALPRILVDLVLY